MSFQEEKLAEIDKLMKEGRFQKAIEIVDGIKKQPGKSKYEQIDLEILRIQILFKMGNFDETLRNIKLVLFAGSIISTFLNRYLVDYTRKSSPDKSGPLAGALIVARAHLHCIRSAVHVCSPRQRTSGRARRSAIRPRARRTSRPATGGRQGATAPIAASPGRCRPGDEKSAPRRAPFGCCR